MAKLNPYLTFNGNCREAMTFYRDCLGGELSLQTLGDSPLSDQIPSDMKGCIVHATLENEGFVIMGSDMAPLDLYKGNAVSIMLHCENEAEIKQLYAKLSEGGRVSQPLEMTYWGALFGELMDKFGNYWLLNWQGK